MIRGIYTAVSGLITQEAKQDSITNNLANVNTVGYKGDNISVKSFDDVLIENYDKVVNGKNTKNTIGSLSFGSKIDETNVNFTQGMIQSTDKATDFAIEGSGFFTVNRDNQQYYTRDGHFHINMQGYLVNDSGDQVLGRNLNGQVEPIRPGNGSLQCDASGTININNTPMYKFATADFENYRALQKVGDNLYQGGNPTNGDKVAVKQNALEKSNVNVMNEMVNMMAGMRTFESSQKVMQTMDETLGKAVNEVGSVR